jgi:hypothetical protein
MEEAKKGGWWSKFWGEKTYEEAKDANAAVKEDLTNLENENQAQNAKLGELEEANATLNEELTAAKNATVELEAEVKELKEAQSSILEATGFETLEALSADHKKVIEHNIELGGREKSATPLDDQENVSAEHKSGVPDKPLSVTERVAAIEARIEAEAAAKQKEKEEK